MPATTRIKINTGTPTTIRSVDGDHGETIEPDGGPRQFTGATDPAQWIG